MKRFMNAIIRSVWFDRPRHIRDSRSMYAKQSITYP
jgi:hypothetical protein